MYYCTPRLALAALALTALAVLIDVSSAGRYGAVATTCSRLVGGSECPIAVLQEPARSEAAK